MQEKEDRQVENSFIRIRTRSCNPANCKGDEEQEKACKKKKTGKYTVETKKKVLSDVHK